MDPIKSDRASLVNFICTCGTSHTKTVKALKTTGAFCKDCSQKNTQIKRLTNKIAINELMLSRSKAEPPC
jgi:hypothetical protein